MKFCILGFLTYIAITQAFQNRFWRQVKYVDKKPLCRLDAWHYTISTKKFFDLGCIARIWNKTHDLLGHMHLTNDAYIQVRTKATQASYKGLHTTEQVYVSFTSLIKFVGFCILFFVLRRY